MPRRALRDECGRPGGPPKAADKGQALDDRPSHFRGERSPPDDPVDPRTDRRDPATIVAEEDADDGSQ